MFDFELFYFFLIQKRGAAHFGVNWWDITTDQRHIVLLKMLSNGWDYESPASPPPHFGQNSNFFQKRSERGSSPENWTSVSQLSLTKEYTSTHLLRHIQLSFLLWHFFRLYFWTNNSFSSFICSVINVDVKKLQNLQIPCIITMMCKISVSLLQFYCAGVWIL